ncbi:UDP-3-O-(3-hydroxymyristoyl)glucosamine N-acyltransferase [Marinomonas posidonica]|uniref:UDP-3-O-(3-hydroxymyristoyl)glucosamine N-acyltransferase n=1 Tax=Marinomonas posidonica TaxID=936476 RepID=UPI0037361DB9
MNYTLGQLAEKVGGVVKGDSNLVIDRLGTLEKSTKNALSFLANPKYQSQLAQTKAGAVLVKTEELAVDLDHAIIVANPYLAFAQLTHLFVPLKESWLSVHPSAVVADDVQLGNNVVIGPNAVIDCGVIIGDDCVIGANTVVSRGCSLGRATRLYPNVTFYHDVSVGADCIFHSGCIVGADGFGFAPNNGEWEKIDQLGGVVIGDRVEIGSSTTIDRGAIENTQIGHGVKIDNQVQIAHNVVIGDNTAIAACAAIAGSARIGAFCTISGCVGIAGHITITDHVHITAMSMVSKSIPEAGSYSSGMGLEPTPKWRRSVARFRRIDNMAKQITTLEQKINKLSEKVDV